MEYYGKEVQKTMKINIVKAANIAGTVMGIAGSLLTAWAGQKTAERTITEKVAETFANHVKKQ